MDRGLCEHPVDANSPVRTGDDKAGLVCKETTPKTAPIHACARHGLRPESKTKFNGTIGEVWNGMRRYGFRELGFWMLTAGFMIGVITNLVVAYGGG